MLVENRRLALALGEQFEHALNVRAAAAAGEFAIAEGAGAAFAEEIIAFGMECAAGVELFDVADPLVDRRAALQHERTVALLRQKIGGHQSARPGADHHRAMAQRQRADRRHGEWSVVAEFDLFGATSP